MELLQSYINTVLTQAPITEAISRVAAIDRGISANNKMLEQQKADKEAIAEKQIANNEAINTVVLTSKSLQKRCQQKLMKVAKSIFAEKAGSAEGEKIALLEQAAAQKQLKRQRQLTACSQQAGFKHSSIW